MSDAGDRSDLLAELDAIANRTMTREEFEAYVNAPMTDDERDEILSLHTWFTRRYPTAGERLAYARRAYARWEEARRLAQSPVRSP